MTLSNLVPRQHELMAIYLGDKNWAAGHSAAIPVTVSSASTSTTVVPTVASNQVVLTATVTPSPGVGTPTGSLQFVDTVKNRVVATAGLSGGIGSATFGGAAAAAVEGRAIAAVYSGDGDFQTSTSAPLPLTENSAWNSSGNFAPNELAGFYGIAGLSGDITGAAPGIFTASSTGQGLFAGQVIYVAPDGTQTVASPANPIDLAVAGPVWQAREPSLLPSPQTARRRTR